LQATNRIILKAINLHLNHTGKVERQECKFGPLDIVKVAHSLKVRVPKAAETNRVPARRVLCGIGWPRFTRMQEELVNELLTRFFLSQPFCLGSY
jgi:hypothetical protein